MTEEYYCTSIPDMLRMTASKLTDRKELPVVNHERVLSTHGQLQGGVLNHIPTGGAYN